MAPSMAVSTCLFLIVVTAILSMHGLAFRNGTADYRDSFNVPGATLLDSEIPLQLPRTGIKRLDDYVALMLNIFWVDLDERRIVAHIQGTHFLGTLSSTWLIMLVEAHRTDVSSGFLIQTYVMETIGELLGLGIFTPIWCMLQLSNIPASKPRRILRRDSISLPIALVLGHFAPTVLMALSDPAASGFFSQQTWVLIRLVHPLWTYIIWQVLRRIIPVKDETTSTRSWYSTAIIISTALHIMSYSPVLGLWIFPGWLHRLAAQQLDVWRIFVPAPFWTPIVPKIESFDVGVAQFLQWDEIATAAGICVWAYSQYAHAGALGKTIDLKLTTWAHFGVIFLLGGPGALAAFLMQECDRAETEKLITPKVK